MRGSRSASGELIWILNCKALGVKPIYAGQAGQASPEQGPALRRLLDGAGASAKGRRIRVSMTVPRPAANVTVSN